MNYPVWYVPVFGGSWVIGITAILHVFISHFAVGGFLYLVLLEARVYRENIVGLREYLLSHTRFFILVTVVFGAISGVGIWFSIGLVNPATTSVLIHQFVWLWALEYVFFFVEGAAAAAYYYGWDRMRPRTHLIVGWIYVVSAWMSLVVITGILSFMITPGRWPETRSLAHAFFNPTYWPSMLLRTAVSLALAGLFGMATASRLTDSDLRTSVLRFGTRFLTPIYLASPVLLAWFLINAPQLSRETLQTGIANTGVGNLSILTRVSMLSIILTLSIGIFTYVGAYLNVRYFTTGFAALFLVVALMVTGATEWSREMLRKPFTIYGYLYSNGLLVSDIPRLNREGALSAARWTPLLGADLPDPQRQGFHIFMSQCVSCHTTRGYRSISRMLVERDEAAILSFLETLSRVGPDNPYQGIMPPFAGTAEDRRVLAAYLASIRGTPVDAPGGVPSIARPGGTRPEGSRPAPQQPETTLP